MGRKGKAWKQTQKKTMEGDVTKLSTPLQLLEMRMDMLESATENQKKLLPARDKAIRKAKLNLMKIKRCCGSFDCSCNELHSIPFKVTGKSGSVRVTLIPAPQGTGLVVADELKKVLQTCRNKRCLQSDIWKEKNNI